MFEDIRPYDDAATCDAMFRLADHPVIEKFNRFLYPGEDSTLFRETLRTVTSVDDFQSSVMSPAIGRIVSLTTSGLTFDGMEYFRDFPKRRYLILSNHRDIVLDSAFLQHLMVLTSLPTTEIAVGDNLVSIPFVNDLMRSNRMVKVVRSGSPRELYAASAQLSEYIRRRINGLSLDQQEAVPSGDGGASIWLAHRQGRTKNGYDQTEQGLLKMLDMSGRGTFEENFGELNILPLSISYEYEPCGVRKAVENWKRAVNGSYTKAQMEDIESIITGITQKKGRVHMQFCEPLTAEEIADAASFDKNERYRRLAEIIDSRIVDGYHLWETSASAAAMLEGGSPDADFQAYIEGELASLSDDCDRDAVRNELLKIFAAPFLRKKSK